MKKISSWFHGIKGKLLVASALPIVGFGIANIISSTGISSINELLSSSHREIIPNMESLQEMRYERAKFAQHIYAAIEDVETSQHANPDIEIAKNSLLAYEEAYKQYSSASFMEQEATSFTAVKESFPKMIALMTQIHSLLATKDPAKVAEAKKLIKTDYITVGASISDFSTNTLQLYRDRAHKEGTLAASTQTQVSWWTMTTIIIANIFISGYLLWLGGNLSNTVATIASQMNHSAAAVATSVEELNHTGTSLSQASTESAASLEETVASLEELSSMVRMNSDNAKQAASLSASSRDAAESGQKEMKVLIESMTKISDSSRKIEEIIHVIDDIAFQTNLLALNAAVEAARAGEQGKGFAVVAEAVRSLAQRSASAAKDITHLIKASVSQVNDGSRLATNSGRVLDSIVSAVKKVSDLNDEIATASSEQTAGIQQISKAMNQLDQSSQSNAASAEKISEAGGEINALAQRSLQLTVDLNKVVYGNMQPPTAVATKTSPAGASTAPDAHPKNLVAFAPRAAASIKPAASEVVIPFDEDFGQVGTTEGF